MTLVQAPNTYGVAKVQLKLEDYCRIIVPTCYDYKCSNCERHPIYYTQGCIIVVFPKSYLKDKPNWMPFPAQIGDKAAEYDEGTFSWV